MRQKILKAKRYKERFPVEVILKYQKLSELYIEKNIIPRLERTLYNFDRLWTDCPGIPKPATEELLVVEIVIYCEHNNHFYLGDDGYMSFASASARQQMNCYVFRQVIGEFTVVEALEHEFSHALWFHWVGRAYINRLAEVYLDPEAFLEGCAEWIAHGWDICHHLEYILKRVIHEYPNLKLGDISLFRSVQYIWKGNQGEISKQDRDELYVLSWIKLTYIRKKKAKVFSKLVKWIQGCDYKKIQAYDEKFSSEYQKDFENWMQNPPPVKVSEECSVDSCGFLSSTECSERKAYLGLFSISPSTFEECLDENNCLDLEMFSPLFDDGRQSVELLKIWGIESAKALQKEMLFATNQQFNYFIMNIEIASSSKSVYALCEMFGLASMLSDQSQHLQALIEKQKEIKRWSASRQESISKTNTKAPKKAKPKPKSDKTPQRELLGVVLGHNDEEIILGLLNACNLREICTTFSDVCVALDIVSTHLKDTELCKSLLFDGKNNPKKSFSELVNKQFWEKNLQDDTASFSNVRLGSR